MDVHTVSIIGCGWIGMPLAEQLLTTGHRVKGSTTTPEKLDLLRQKGIDAYMLRLQPEPVGDIATLLQADTLVIDIPPKAGKLGDDFHPQQIRYLVDALPQSSVKHIIYTSSTSVYPDINPLASDTRVTENYPLTVETSPSPGLTQTEQLIQNIASTDNANQRVVTIVRCAGLVGYDRIPGKYVAGRTVDTGAVPVNYLHRDDAVGILHKLIEKPLAGIVNAVAPEHPVREAIYRKSCADFDYELPTFVQPAQPIPHKVVSGEKLAQIITYQFKYPDPLQFFYKR